ncbi:SRPBCC family protein [Phaeobacter marinintestinus]|uniref:SRPBCC family protein n=1 Tax=Falsiphaeobacter marinintestinus TaxID=1492905 RepID=UPI0011B7597A|nr:SRPBCC domain-containing protein [Phaeobacter marinintestinus]
MTDLRLERTFPVTPEHLFDWMTKPENLTAWWGPEGMHVTNSQLDFTRTGPWFAVIVSDEGGRYKVSGQVTRVDPPNTIGFTWGWHDENDKRGPDSHVTFTILPDSGGAKLVVDHRDLVDAEMAASHERGWVSSLNSLAATMT